MQIPFLAYIGAVALKTSGLCGQYALFVVKTGYIACTTKLKKNKLFIQMEKIGLQSLPISILTGFFAGMVLALQTYSAFRKFGSEKMIGPVVALTMARELSPVLTGLMVAGRCSSGIAAEIGTMKITEQIDALETLCINSFQYLIVPRILASIMMLPFLTVFSTACGIMGGYFACICIFGLNPVDYVDGIKELVSGLDIAGGAIKSAVFGFILGSVGAYKGFYTWDGARGVGIATTQSVVIASIAILVSNYFLSTLLFG